MRRKPIFPIMGIAAMVCGLIALAFEAWVIGAAFLAVGAFLVARGGTRLSSEDREG